jgi:ferric-dicitrate binding protein FerR (iron transport regulator)
MDNLDRLLARYFADKTKLDTAGRADARWHRLAKRIKEDPVRHPQWYQPAMRAAAVVLLLASAAVAGWWVWAGRDHSRAVALREVHTAKAQRLAVQLSDGTRVTLGPASRLTWDERAFGRASRAVTLEGQAYFDVTHDPAHPFSVSVDGVVARDLGTRFTARAFPNEPPAVAVEEGRVSIARRADTLAVAVIEPGQVGTLDSTGRIDVTRIATPDAFFAWTRGRLVFHDTPMAEALSQLDRWYDIRFRLEDPAAGRRLLTASFDRESLSEVLEVLRLTLDLDVHRTGDTVVLGRPR